MVLKKEDMLFKLHSESQLRGIRNDLLTFWQYHAFAVLPFSEIVLARVLNLRDP